MTLRLSTPGSGLDNYVVTLKGPDDQRQLSLTPHDVESYSERSVEELDAKLRDSLADTSPHASWRREDVQALKNSMRDALKKGPYPAAVAMQVSGTTVQLGSGFHSISGKHFDATLLELPNAATSVMLIIRSQATPTDLIADRMNARILEAFGEKPSGCQVVFDEDVGTD